MQAIMEKSVNKMRKRRKLGNKGFSLVELIIVIAIMAALIAILAPQLIRYVESSRQGADLTTFNSILSAFRTAVIDQGDNMAGVATIAMSWRMGDVTGTPNVWIDGAAIPTADPRGGGGATTAQLVGWEMFNIVGDTVLARSNAATNQNTNIVTITYTVLSQDYAGTGGISITPRTNLLDGLNGLSGIDMTTAPVTAT